MSKAPESLKTIYTSRWAHGLSLVVVLGVTSWLLATYGSARESAAVVFGVVGTAATLFALLIALVEILRLEGAASISQHRVEEALDQLDNERKMASATECKVLIESALDVLDSAGRVPSSTILRISRSYRLVLIDGANDETGERATNVELLDSYVTLDPRQTAKIKKIKATLVAMAHDLRPKSLKDLQ